MNNAKWVNFLKTLDFFPSSFLRNCKNFTCLHIVKGSYSFNKNENRSLDTSSGFDTAKFVNETNISYRGNIKANRLGQ